MSEIVRESMEYDVVIVGGGLAVRISRNLGSDFA